MHPYKGLSQHVTACHVCVTPDVTPDVTAAPEGSLRMSPVITPIEPGTAVHGPNTPKYTQIPLVSGGIWGTCCTPGYSALTACHVCHSGCHPPHHNGHSGYHPESHLLGQVQLYTAQIGPNTPYLTHITGGFGPSADPGFRGISGRSDGTIAWTP